MNFTRTRIAPTPSGYLHLGNVLSFALTAYLAERSGASVLLRIDDLDRERVQKEYVQDIFDTLSFLDIPWHEGPRTLREFEASFSQLSRLNLYNKALADLKGKNAVFACTCSRSQLAASSKEGYPGTCRNKHTPTDSSDAAWRLFTGNETVTVKTEAGPQIVVELADVMKDFIVRKKDGYPAYQLSSVIDDLNYDVDLVVRGADLWESTVAQHYLAMKMGEDRFSEIAFVHHPLLKTDNGVKFSKSAGDTSIHYLRKQGKQPQEIFGVIGRMIDVEETVENWQSLGRAIYERGTLLYSITG